MKYIFYYLTESPDLVKALFLSSYSSLFISPECEEASQELKTVWNENWNKIDKEQKVTNKLIEKIDKVKRITRDVLKVLY